MADDERRQYEASLKEYWDYTSTMDTAYRKGEKKGRAEEKKAIARSLKSMGLPVGDIVKATGLTAEDIQSL